MLVYHETFRLPPVKEHWSKPLQFTWCHWLNQETDTDVTKHYLSHFLFTICTAITWMPYEHLGVKWWVKLFGYLYALLTPVSLFAGITLLCHGVPWRRNPSVPVVQTSATAWGRCAILRSRDCFGREIFAQSRHCAQVGKLFSFFFYVPL